MRDIIQRQQNRIDDLEKRMMQAEKQVEAAEQYSRQDCLILRGKLDIRPNCSLRDEVMRIILHHTGIQFPAWCLNTVHWLGKGDSLIVRFNNKGVREAIYRNRVPKEVNKRGLFIHESLTSSKMQTVSKCARLRREGTLVTYYTQSGNVFAKRTRETPALLIPDNLNEQEISQLLERQPSSYREAVINREPGSRQLAKQLTDRAPPRNPEGGTTDQGLVQNSTQVQPSDIHAPQSLTQGHTHSEDTTDQLKPKVKEPDSDQAAEEPKAPVTLAEAESEQTLLTTQTTQDSLSLGKDAKEMKAPVKGCQKESTEIPRNKPHDKQKKDTEEGSDTCTVISSDTGTGPQGMPNISGEGQGNLSPDSGMNTQVDKESLVPCLDDDTASENSSSPLAKKLPRKSKRRKANNK